MEPHDVLHLEAAPHPLPAVRQAGFPLDHPYVEQCWAPVVGPTSVLLLRRLPLLWRQSLTADVDPAELAASLGLGHSTGRNGPLHRTLDRLVRFRFASEVGPSTFEVFTEAPPLAARQLDRLPAWTRTRHESLLSTHLERLAELHRPTPQPTDLTTRLDRLTRPNPTRTTVPSLHR